MIQSKYNCISEWNPSVEALRWKFRTSRIPYNENSIRRKFSTANIPYDEKSIRRNFRAMKIPYEGKSLRQKILQWKFLQRKLLRLKFRPQVKTSLRISKILLKGLFYILQTRYPVSFIVKWLLPSGDDNIKIKVQNVVHYSYTNVITAKKYPE